MTSTRLRYVEVCAGAGGLGLGLHRAGWTGTGSGPRVYLYPYLASEHHRLGTLLCILKPRTALRLVSLEPAPVRTEEPSA